MRYAVTKENVKIIGRTALIDGVCWCGQSGSGISFCSTAKKISVWIKGDSNTSNEIVKDPARLGIYINGIRTVDMTMETPSCCVSICERDVQQNIEVMVLKLSECAMSVIGIEAVETDDNGLIAPTQKNQHRIEFIGDSITCGFGIDLEKPDTEFETRTEDFTRTYAYKLAERFQADYSVVSYSGYGVLSGYTETGEKNTLDLVPPLYNRTGFSNGYLSNGKRLEDICWNFEQFQPQLIVINLGTNDTCYCRNDWERQKEFVESYIEFLKRIRIYNPDASMLGMVGSMGTIMCGAVLKAIHLYTEQTGDINIQALALPEQLPEDGLVTGNHPTEKTHKKIAMLVEKKIREMMDW